MQDKTGVKNIFKTLIVTILSLVILFFFFGIKSERERKEKVSIILNKKAEDQKIKKKTK